MECLGLLSYHPVVQPLSALAPLATMMAHFGELGGRRVVARWLGHSAFIVGYHLAVLWVSSASGVFNTPGPPAC